MVDRRIVVDEAADKARKIAKLLNATEIATPIVKEVAERLKSIGGGKALHVSRSTRAAVWLAIEAFPLFPVLPVRGRLHTRAFDRRATKFRWPIWDGTLTTEAIRTALGVPEVFDDDAPVEALRRLAIRAVLESERVTIGQGYGQLRPAVRVR